MQTGLVLHTSNQLEILAAELAQVLAEPLRSPFAPDIVVVQSNGMRRWLTQQIAQTLGVCCNVSFPFPQRFFRDRFEAAVPDVSASAIYEPAAMTWRVLKLLPRLASQPDFAPVANYLRGEQREQRAYELARNIARVFDRYIIFRPRLILGWDEGKGDGWQPILWREIQTGAPAMHQAALGLRLAQALQHKASLPERVCVFGISSLPPFHASLFEEMAKYCCVHFFIMEPTPEWWGDVRTRREKARVKQPELFDFEQQDEEDNPLLAENGRQGRDFLNIVADLNPHHERQNFQAPPADIVLHKIQHDIFEQVSGAPEVGEDDGSVQIHSCHSVVRELEVLQDQLLALFERDPKLTPRDIVVMAPDISVYAPYIDAIFGAPENDEHAIPYAIADRPPRARSGVIDTFLRVLEVLPGRFPVSEVFAVLESGDLQRRFRMEPADVLTIRGWCEHCGICWGIDADHRARLGLPAFAENSWRQGLDRMLLGCAMQPTAHDLFAGILPFDEIEGSDALLLGNFVEFVERLFSLARDFATPRSLARWQNDFATAIDNLFAADDSTQRELNHLRVALADLGEISVASGNDDAVPLPIVQEELEHLLNESSLGAAFLSGGMTFCALKPMRSIPFKVVCLLGLNDTAYPRRERNIEFDLIAQNPQRGDRRLREDDRALFLEALLSARDVFYLSYLGQSLRDNKDLPPSVLVSELLDYVSRRFGFEKFVIKHPLQAFSAGNFRGDDPRRFSYSVDNSTAGRIAESDRIDSRPFLERPLAEAGAEWREVEIVRLIEFFAHPAKFFVRNRLGIDLPRGREEREDREPFALHSLENYKIGERLVADVLEGIDPSEAFSIVQASGVLPPAESGALAFDDLCQIARAFAEQIRPHVKAKKNPPLLVREKIGDFSLQGTLDQIWGETLVRYRLAKFKAKDLLGTWIEHLARNLTEQKPALLFGKEGARRFAPVENAREILQDLLALYWRGLREPLPFYPRSSWDYARRMADEKNEWRAKRAAWQTWLGNEHEDDGGKGERRDPYLRLLFRHRARPLSEEWKEITCRIFDPMLKQSERYETDL
jgi:exodeoxyribonuclease V gamma subunit